MDRTRLPRRRSDDARERRPDSRLGTGFVLLVVAGLRWFDRAAFRLSVRRVSIALGALALLTSCSGGADNAEMQRRATTVARAISSPRQSSADGLVRAALSTSAAQNTDSFRVVEAKDMKAKEIHDPFARLVFWFHDPGGSSGFNRSDPVTACYAATFNFYGVMGTPSAVGCPADTSGIVPGPRTGTTLPYCEFPCGG